MKVGDLVKIKTKHYGTKMGVVTKRHPSPFVVEWVVQPVNHSRPVICSHRDLEVISESR